MDEVLVKHVISAVFMTLLVYTPVQGALSVLGEVGNVGLKQETLLVVNSTNGHVTWQDAVWACHARGSDMFAVNDHTSYQFRVLHDSMNYAKWPTDDLAWFGAIKPEGNLTWFGAETCQDVNISVVGTDLQLTQCAAIFMTSENMTLVAKSCSTLLPYICDKRTNDSCTLEKLLEVTINLTDVYYNPDLNNQTSLGSASCADSCLTTDVCIGITYIDLPTISGLCYGVTTSHTSPWKLTATTIPLVKNLDMVTYVKKCKSALIITNASLPLNSTEVPCIVTPDDRLNTTLLTPTTTTTRTATSATMTQTTDAPTTTTPMMMTTTTSTTPTTFTQSTLASTTTPPPTTTTTRTATSATLTQSTDAPRTTTTPTTMTTTITTSSTITQSTNASTTTTSPTTTTTPTTLMTTTTPVSNATPGPVCACNCSSLSSDEIEAMAEKIRKELTIDKKSTGASVRKRTSAGDSRMSSTAMGSTGIGILLTVFGMVVACDCLNVARNCSKGGKNRTPGDATVSSTLSISNFEGEPQNETASAEPIQAC